MVIGRETADITINDAEISGRHAEVRLSGAGLEIEDLGSTNGTFVNGERIEGDHQLAPGDVIKVGNTELALDSPTDAATGPATGGGTAVSRTPDFSGEVPADTAPHTAAAGTKGPGSGPVEIPSPSPPTGIEPGTHSITPPHGGEYAPPPPDAYPPPPTGGAYLPPQAQGGYPAPGPNQGPAPGVGAPSAGQAPSYGTPQSGSPGGYAGAPGGTSSGKNKTPLIIGIVAAVVVIAVVLVFFVLKPFAASDEEKIREVATEFGAQFDDPAVCRLVTQSYLEEVSGQTGEAAIDACEADLAEEPLEVEIHSVEINGDQASVEAEFDGEAGTLELEKQDDGEWLISGGS